MKNCLDSSGDSFKEKLDQFDMETGEYNMNTMGNNSLEISKDLQYIDSNSVEALKH